MSISSVFGAPMAARVAVYVPGTVGAVSEDSGAAAAMVERVAGRLSSLFGGATISAASGAWVSDTFGLVREAVNIVYSYTTAEQLEQHAGEIRAIAEQVKTEMKQEAVSVEINNALYLI